MGHCGLPGTSMLSPLRARDISAIVDRERGIAVAESFAQRIASRGIGQDRVWMRLGYPSSGSERGPFRPGGVSPLVGGRVPGAFAGGEFE